MAGRAKATSPCTASVWLKACSHLGRCHCLTHTHTHTYIHTHTHTHEHTYTDTRALTPLTSAYFVYYRYAVLPDRWGLGRRGQQCTSVACQRRCLSDTQCCMSMKPARVPCTGPMHVEGACTARCDLCCPAKCLPCVVLFAVTKTHRVSYSTGQDVAVHRVLETARLTRVRVLARIRSNHNRGWSELKFYQKHWHSRWWLIPEA